MGNLLTALGVVGAIIGIAAGGTAVALYLRAGYAKARIDDLRSQLVDERELVGSLRERVEHLERADAAKADRLNAVEAENRALRAAPQLVVDGIAGGIRELTILVDKRIPVPTSDIAENLEALAVGLRTLINTRGGGP